jgi:hypothetical protein
MTNALLTPFDLAAPTRTGRQMFRKQILKKGTINYKGQQITFDDPFLKDVVRSFNRGAYDQVPFVLADPKNRHNMDPERFRGEVKGLELTEDGLDMIVETTAEGAKTVQSNPRMGVSARIVQGLTKSDGRTYKRAIQHVLATMDPRLTGMRPWEAVDLSEEDGEGDDEVEVIDLTAASIKEGTRVANKTAKRAAAGSQTVQLDLSNMTDERFQELLDFVSQDGEEPEDDGDGEDEDDDETVEEVTSKQTVKRKGFGKQVVEDVEDEDEDDEDDDSDEDDDEEEVEPVAKSKKREKVSLSNPVAKVKRAKVSKSRRLELELAADRWERKRGDFLRAGVPPVLLDLAAPILSQPDKLVIDLSETGEESVDAKLIVGKLLNEVQGLIDLAPEMGHGIITTPDKESETGKALAAWDKEYGSA